MNLLVDLRAYEGSNANTCNSSFARNAQYIGIDISEEVIQEVVVAASSTKNLFTVASVDSKKFVYLEVTGECDISVNGTAESTIKPIVINDTKKRGVFLKSTDVYSVDVTNNGTEEIKVYFITVK